MWLESGEDEYIPEHGRTFLYLNFEILNDFQLKKNVTRKISLHVKTDDLGVIDDCYTLGSYTWNGGSRRKFEKWNHRSKRKIVSHFGKPVILGDNEFATGSLAVKGNVLISNSKKLDQCSSQIEGALRYDANSRSLQGCNGIRWITVERNEITKLNFVQFEAIANSRNKISERVTPTNFLYCEVEQNLSDSGSCETRAMSTTGNTKWNLKAKTEGTENVRCKFKCYR